MYEEILGPDFMLRTIKQQDGEGEGEHYVVCFKENGRVAYHLDYSYPTPQAAIEDYLKHKDVLDDLMRVRKQYEEVFGPHYYLHVDRGAGDTEAGGPARGRYSVRTKDWVPNESILLKPLQPWYPTPQAAVEDYRKHQDALNENVWYFDGRIDGGMLDGSWYIRFPRWVATNQDVITALQAVFAAYNASLAPEGSKWARALTWDDIGKIPGELWQQHEIAVLIDKDVWPDGRPAVSLHFRAVWEINPLANAFDEDEIWDAPYD